MSDACIIAAGAVSALGIGPRAYGPGEPGQPARSAIRRDGEFAAAGMKRPNIARAPRELPAESTGDRGADLLICALEQVCDSLDECLPDWRSRRIGVALGTSSGGMLAAERYFASLQSGGAPDLQVAHRATYFAPFCDGLAAVGIDVGPATGWTGAQGVVAPGASARGPAIRPVRSTQVLAACASSTIAIGLGMRWLGRQGCDLVLAGGYDGVSLFVAAGFEAIRATTESLPRPFRMGRDGMALGEGACVLALVPAGQCAGGEPLAYLEGFGASNDAVHITAPDRTGAGLARAAERALREAAVDGRAIHLCSAHGTGTPYNDAMEARAVAAVCPGPDPPVVHPFKAQIGHTLGAAGALETMAAVEALRQQRAPAACGEGEIDPDATVRLLDRVEPARLDRVLKLSAAFGGVTAALVLGREPGREARRAARPVVVLDHARVAEVDREQLALATGVARDRLARIDDLGQLAVAATAALVERVGREALCGAGVVMGHGLATVDVNARFDERLRSKGPRMVDPRLFPATSPNAAAGHCAIAFGLTGPNFAVSAGLGGAVEALLVAAELVAAGDAERMVVVAADDAGPVARQWLERLGLDHRPLERGAVAVLLAAEPAEPGDRPRVELDQAIEHDVGPVGHLALCEWLAQRARVRP